MADNAKFKNEHKCQAPHLTEDMLKSAYIDVFNSLIDNREEIISVIRQTIEKLMVTTAIDKKLFMAKNAADNKLKTVQEYMALSGKVVIDQKVYNEKFDRLMDIYQKAEDEYTRIKCEKTELRTDANAVMHLYQHWEVVVSYRNLTRDCFAERLNK